MIYSKTFNNWRDVIKFLNDNNLTLDSIQILPCIYDDLEFGIVTKYIVIFNECGDINV